MRVGFSGLVLIAAIIFALAFASAPWFAFRALRSAAQNQDILALGELVDYNAVRGGLRSQIRPTARAQIPPPNIWNDPLGAMRRALEAPMEQPVQVDAFLTPAALARMADGRAPLDRSPAVGAPRFPMITYWDVNRCRIAVEDPAAPARRTIFTWQRRGLFAWKLVLIRLPSAPAAPPA